MMDHTVSGIPIAQLPDWKLRELQGARLQDNVTGAEIVGETWWFLQLRIEIEFLIRARGMRPGC